MVEYKAIKKYCTKQSLIAHHSDELMRCNDETGADVFSDADVIIKKDNDNLYQVDIVVDITVVTSVSKAHVYDIHIIYSTIVAVYDNNLKEHILMVDVPNDSIKDIRKMILQMTVNAGYIPLKIAPFDFEERFKKAEHEFNI